MLLICRFFQPLKSSQSCSSVLASHTDSYDVFLSLSVFCKLTLLVLGCSSEHKEMKEINIIL